MNNAELMKYLEDEYGDGRKGVDMLWNPSNHRLLDEDDFKTLADERGVHAWHFQQRAVRFQSLFFMPCLCDNKTEVLPSTPGLSSTLHKRAFPEQCADMFVHLSLTKLVTSHSIALNILGTGSSRRCFQAV